LKTWQSIFLGVTLGLLFSASIFIILKPRYPQTPILLPTKTAEKLTVHISGEVQNPGVYELGINTRVMDAVNAAGGFSSMANQEAINLAALLEDGDRIVIPGENSQTTQTQNNVQGTLININTASAQELDQLPGVGMVKAQAIVDYREKNGYFLSITDLMNVPGIGPELYDQIKIQVTVNP
jgi:competence protein ComEA